MPPLYSLGGWLAAIVWFGYGFFTGDMHIMIPNAAGVVRIGVERFNGAELSRSGSGSHSNDHLVHLSCA